MDDFKDILNMVDKLFEAKINNELLKQATDDRVKNLIKLLNEYGIHGTKAIGFLQKMAIVCGEGDTDAEL
jgi:hypothetical protein